MSWTDSLQLDWEACINLILQTMQALQLGLLQLLGWLHLVPTIDGQPAWPFALRLSGEVMLIDRNVVRALLAALAWQGAALLLLALAWRWRRGRWPLLGVAVALGWCAPWPDAALLTTAATPTSFQTSPAPFSATSIVRGEQVYARHCLACHGADGRGNTPLALSLPIAPPNLSSGLLWRRFDGDLYWSLRHGKGSMPGYAERLSVTERWDLIDFMKANAAGVAARETGTWPRPVALPDLALDCRRASVTHARQWQGQRIRLVVAGASAPAEDPRLQSVLLGSDGRAPRSAVGAIDCASHDASALRAIAILTGLTVSQLPGTELIADRDGWLRARSSDGAWSQSDMLCRSPSAGVAAKPASAEAAGGIDQLIAAMDAEPVRFIKGGFVH
ncbi:c-type cytochrome [Herbaspirillum huttiense]|uniref:Cytochrome c n=1 Tax=Herbaspirillum huttiense subsp. lycopersici TaxID=3074428 RepID=A0ABU2EK63_9BURK|nr:cytochrome c [Herbaspirillum huttiense]MDR9848535.1 cytochrome c [Herbaspirillum huttiense SE1]